MNSEEGAELDRFTIHLEAQSGDNGYISLAEAHKEIANGRKVGHWIWYVFPQIPGLGTSDNSKKFALTPWQASRYLLHSELRERYIKTVEWTEKSLRSSGRTLDGIFKIENPTSNGYASDKCKVISSLTLFEYETKKLLRLNNKDRIAEDLKKLHGFIKEIRNKEKYQPCWKTIAMCEGLEVKKDNPPSHREMTHSLYKKSTEEGISEEIISVKIDNKKKEFEQTQNMFKALILETSRQLECTENQVKALLITLKEFANEKKGELAGEKAGFSIWKKDKDFLELLTKNWREYCDEDLNLGLCSAISKTIQEKGHGKTDTVNNRHYSCDAMAIKVGARSFRTAMAIADENLQKNF